MTKCHRVSQSVTKCHKVTVGALEKLSGGWWWWHSDYNLCSWSRSLSFSEILRDSLRFFEIWYGMDLDRSLTNTGDGGLGTETREMCHDNQSLEKEETGSWPDS